MSKRSDEIERLIVKIEENLTNEDSLLIVMHDGLQNEMAGVLMSKHKTNLIAAICSCMESGDDMGRGMMDLVTSVVIGYAKVHPEYATKFIQCYNKTLYGTDLDF